MIVQITPQAAAERQRNSDICLLDVRTPAEFRASHAVGAVNVPLDTLTPDKADAARAGRPLFVICKSGGRSVKACALLEGAMKSEIYNVMGGIEAWVAAGLPAVHQGFHLALDRQVRIVAGLLVLIGCVLGWKVAPGFYALSAFVGAGLFFAGVTGWCGMATLLAKMPWNAH